MALICREGSQDGNAAVVDGALECGRPSYCGARSDSSQLEPRHGRLRRSRDACVPWTHKGAFSRVVEPGISLTSYLEQIMDQIEGGTLIINQGDEAKPKGNAEVDPDERNLNYVEGLAEGWKLAEVRSSSTVPSSTRR